MDALRRGLSNLNENEEAFVIQGWCHDLVVRSIPTSVCGSAVGFSMRRSGECGGVMDICDARRLANVLLAGIAAHERVAEENRARLATEALRREE